MMVFIGIETIEWIGKKIWSREVDLRDIKDLIYN